MIESQKQVKLDGNNSTISREKFVTPPCGGGNRAFALANAAVTDFSNQLSVWRKSDF